MPEGTDLTRRHFVSAFSLVSFISSPASIVSGRAFDKQELLEIFDIKRKFGAKGDGLTNDTAAFNAASRAINERGGGVKLLVPPGVYIVGDQNLAGRSGLGYSYRPSEILKIEKCRNPVYIEGQGATLRAAPGLKAGSFDPLTGLPVERNLPFYDYDFRADPYWGLVEIRDNEGFVSVAGLDLDGNIEKIELGGAWGDLGWQVSACGIYAYGNESLSIKDVHSHHHALDGIMIGHPKLSQGEPERRHELINVRSEFNARQGLSWVGGNHLKAVGCKFNSTGRARFSSAPGAGVDIEAEDSICRNAEFIDCEMADNVGVGFLASVGEVSHVTLINCKFVGTTNWSAWPNKPHIKFLDCVFVGALVNAYPSARSEEATKFVRCLITSDIKYSQNKIVFGSILADFGAGSKNVTFDECRIETGGNVKFALPFTNPETIYNNNIFFQDGKVTSYPRGIFKGKNIIITNGELDLTGSVYLGDLIINTKKVPRS